MNHGRRLQNRKGNTKTKTRRTKKGQRPDEYDAVAVATLIGSLFMVQVMGGLLLGQFRDVLNACMTYIATGTVASIPGMLKEVFKITALSFVVMAGPFLAVTALLAVGVTFFQTKMLVAGSPSSRNSAGSARSRALNGCFPCAALSRP